jgi:hypothetical protein
MKTENLKIAIFPIGSALKFNEANIKRADGTSEYFKLFYALARNPNVSEVWIMQRSDWPKLSFDDKVKIDPRGVLRDIYTEFSIKLPPGRRSDSEGKLMDRTKEEEERYKDLWEKVKSLEQPDFGIGFAAQGLTLVNIPGIIPGIMDPSKMTGTLDMTSIYSAPLIHYLNMSKLPWFMIMTDPRYVKENQKWRDMVNGPIEGVAQYNKVINFTHFDRYPEPSLGNEITEDLKITYSGIEKLNLVREQVVPPNTERSNKFAIVAMQSSYGKAKTDYRLEALKKWILTQSNSNDFNIYGKWDERFVSKYPQFKGYKDSEEIDTIFKNTRYTFIIPIRPDWVTSKYVEMLRVGVVPFFHPDYDTQFSTIPKDHYLRVKTPKELFEKIDELEKNPELRISMVKKLQLQFLSGVRKGEFLCDVFNPFLERAGIQVRMEKGFSEEVLRTPDEEAAVNLNSATGGKVFNSASLF